MLEPPVFRELLKYKHTGAGCWLRMPLPAACACALLTSSLSLCYWRHGVVGLFLGAGMEGLQAELEHDWVRWCPVHPPPLQNDLDSRHPHVQQVHTPNTRTISDVISLWDPQSLTSSVSVDYYDVFISGFLFTNYHFYVISEYFQTQNSLILITICLKIIYNFGEIIRQVFLSNVFFCLRLFCFWDLKC